MILPASLKKDEILASTKDFKGADPSIVELVIYAFYLEKTLPLTTLSQNMASNLRSRIPRFLVGLLELA